MINYPKAISYFASRQGSFGAAKELEASIRARAVSLLPSLQKKVFEDAVEINPDADEELDKDDDGKIDLDSKKKANEDIINELSKATLGRYVQRAGKSLRHLDKESGRKDAQSSEIASASHNNPDARDHLYAARKVVDAQRRKIDDKTYKREYGVHRAIKKLVK